MFGQAAARKRQSDLGQTLAKVALRRSSYCWVTDTSSQLIVYDFEPAVSPICSLLIGAVPKPQIQKKLDAIAAQP